MKLLDFINQAPTSYQAVQKMREMLLQNGAAELSETEHWDLVPGQDYFTVKNDSALLAFHIPEKTDAFHIYAAHADSPSFKVKENPEIVVENAYVRLNVERYGGMLMAPWLDRPLSVAGRVIVKKDGGLVSIPVNVDRDLLIIPNLAIHMNREANDGYHFNAQQDMLPLLGGIEAKGKFMEIVAEAAGVEASEILGHDLYLYPRMEGRVFGAENEFIAAPRLDDIECAYAGLTGFLQGKKQEGISVFCMFDNEEVGSSSIQGAGGKFLADTLERISESLNDTAEARIRRLAASFLISADNGHAVHPNHPEKTDPTNRPVVNGGILLKYSANLRYTTDGMSAAMLKELAARAGVPVQIFFNRSDMMGGSTLGNISLSQVPVHSVDIGLAQLAMHSCCETAGVKDYEYLEALAKTFFA